MSHLLRRYGFTKVSNWFRLNSHIHRHISSSIYHQVDSISLHQSNITKQIPLQCIYANFFVNLRQVRPLHSSAPSLGIMDYFRGAVDSAQDLKTQKDQKRSFEVQMKHLVEWDKKFTGDVVLNIMLEQEELSGMTGMKSKLPWVKNNPEFIENKIQIDMWKNLTPKERYNPLRIKGAEKEKLFSRLGVSREQFIALQASYKNAAFMHEWLRRRKKLGKRLPRDLIEMRYMMTEPDSCRPRSK